MRIHLDTFAETPGALAAELKLFSWIIRPVIEVMTYPDVTVRLPASSSVAGFANLRRVIDAVFDREGYEPTIQVRWQ
jgi:hypothetical protein